MSVKEVELVFTEQEADFLSSAMESALANRKLTQEEREQINILNQKFKINDEIKLKVIW